MNASTPVSGGARPLRIALHDYSGHPFQIELSRELARRGHDVTHLHCPSYVTGKGALETRPSDPDTLTIVPVPLASSFAKHSPWKRPLQEIEYGRRLSGAIARMRPDVVVSANCPLLAQGLLLRRCRRLGIPFVFWLQDITSVAIERILRRRLRRAARLFGAPLVRYERRLLAGSKAVVAISEDFRDALLEWRISPARIYVIENWSPIEDVRPAPRDNAWAREHGLTEGFVVLYAGTLGLKHDPGLLLQVAHRMHEGRNGRLVVVSEGRGAEWLQTQARARGLEIRVFPYQPADRFPEVLATADVALAILEQDAGSFSVPSKILSYHAAGRAVVAAVPESNAAARLIRRADSGIIVPPSEADAFAAAVLRLLDEPADRTRLGVNARAYAERAFRIADIADRFEHVIADAVTGRGARPVP